jgi:DNA uptake protein ComE-like DNA-binding protein
MNSSNIKISLIALSLLLADQVSLALDRNVTAPKSAASKAAATSKSAINGKVVPSKVVATIKLVDINSAKKEELKKLPGITEDEASKIIAGRPYGSKTWLVGPNGLTEEKYLVIKDQIIAKQPFKDAAKNAALYKNKID